MRVLRRRAAREETLESVWLPERGTAREKGHALHVLGSAVVIVRHPYDRDPASGSGNCWCGRHQGSSLHDVVVEP